MLNTKYSQRIIKDSLDSKNAHNTLQQTFKNQLSPYHKEINCLDSFETAKKYLYRLKLSGYLEEDFSCYRTKTHLVITTEKRSKDLSDSGNKHFYCYPSAYFKIHIALPEKEIKDEIEMRYENDLLYVELFKVTE